MTRLLLAALLLSACGADPVADAGVDARIHAAPRCVRALGGHRYGTRSSVGVDGLVAIVVLALLSPAPEAR